MTLFFAATRCDSTGHANTPCLNLVAHHQPAARTVTTPGYTPRAKKSKQYVRGAREEWTRTRKSQ